MRERTLSPLMFSGSHFSRVRGRVLPMPQGCKLRPGSIRLQCREMRRPANCVHDETRFKLVLRWNGFSTSGLFERKWTGRVRPLPAAATAPAQTRAAAAPPPALSSARCRPLYPLQTASYQNCRVGSEWESAIIQARVTKQQPHAMPCTCCTRSSRPSAAQSA